MIIKKEEIPNRLIIYFFYDTEGIADRYVSHMLNSLRPHAKEIMVVVNGKFTPESREQLELVVDQILVRENIGFDVWAYKTALEYYGEENLAKYDEVIMMNATIMGPLYPFGEMFAEMDQKDVDFWGLTLYHGAPFDPFGKIKYNFLPTHLQSHFIAVRNKMFTGLEFKQYWANMPMITCYEEAVCWHEAIFTKDFEDAGYQWDVYVDTRDILKESYCPILMSPRDLVRDRKCPVIKRRSFFHDYYDFFGVMNGEASILVFEYIRDHMDYDVDMIWENILRVQNQSDIKRNMHLNYILPSTANQYPNLDVAQKKIALIMHLYFEDLLEENLEYAKSMPPHTDIYITTNTKEKVKVIQSVFKDISCNKLEVLLVENRGRDVSSLLVACKSFVMDYDYVCFCHDKKVGQLDQGIKGKSFAYKCFDNLLHNSTHVQNTIGTFESNPRLGMMMPPPPFHADYYPVLGEIEWGRNYQPTCQLLEKMEIKVPLDQTKEPVAPLGTMFWFRPQALKILFDQDWEYKDFPKEPNDGDGTLLHAIERAYPFVVQHEGYYPAYVLSDNYARIELNNLYFIVRELNKSLFTLYQPNILFQLKCMMDGDYNRYGNRVTALQKTRTGLKRFLPMPIWNAMRRVYYLFKRK